jgi:subtilisin family serine protease
MKTNAVNLASCILWLLARSDVFGQSIGQEMLSGGGEAAQLEDRVDVEVTAGKVAALSRRSLRKRNKKSNSSEASRQRVIVRYKNGAGKAALLIQQSQSGGRVYHDFDDDNVLVLDLNADAIQAIALSEDIDSVEEDGVYEELGHLVRELGDTEEDRRLAETTPYGVSMVQADQVPIGPNRVRVCVADTGVRPHPDLPSTMTGTSRTSSMGKPIYWNGDKIGHGTHTAGTVAAVKGNGVGVMGVAAGASLHITRAIDDVGYARESDIYEAVKQCADAGAKVISLSLGGSSMSSSFKAFVDKLYFEQDIVIVAGKFMVWVIFGGRSDGATDTNTGFLRCYSRWKRRQEGYQVPGCAPNCRCSRGGLL